MKLMSESVSRCEVADDQPGVSIDVQIVHDCLLAMLGRHRDGEGDERQIFHVQFGGADLPAGAQGRKIWYCLDKPVVTAEPATMDTATKDSADQPGVKIIRYGTLFVDKFPEFEGLSEAEVAARKGEDIDDGLMFELAFALTACATQLKVKKGRSVDTVEDTGKFL